eukprot:756423-Hanusia_phi.AAC.4
MAAAGELEEALRVLVEEVKRGIEGCAVREVERPELTLMACLRANSCKQEEEEVFGGLGIIVQDSKITHIMFETLASVETFLALRLLADLEGLLMLRACGRAK